MAFLDNIFGLIDMRSFSSVWYWIVVALYWSSASQTILGAPYDLIMRARRGDNPQNEQDLGDLVGIHVRRKLSLMRRVGHWIVAFSAAGLTAIGVLAVVYRLEFAQAVMLILIPLTIVRLLGLRLAFRVEREHMDGARLSRALLTHRLWIQVLGVISIFVTAVWGMLLVMSRSVLGF
ncbi:MAG: component of SufBCD complex [Natronohydrobacter sp.]|nr:component of SufBCD complex [Natronohydrobacter sp.]